MSRFIVALSSLASFLFGCTSFEGSNGDNQPAEEEDPIVQSAASSCSPADYDKAFGHYRKAVYGAKSRKAGAMCDDSEYTTADGTQYRVYLSEIADNATAAVKGCSAFQNVIKTSPFAEPLRHTLRNTLTLRALTGELRVLDDTPTQDWSHVETMLPGTSMVDYTMGVRVWNARIDFAAGGKATYVLNEEVEGPEGTEFREKATPATYEVQKTGADRAPRRVVVKHDGVTETFDLRVKNDGAPNFILVPVEQDAAGTFVTLNLDECSI